MVSECGMESVVLWCCGSEGGRREERDKNKKSCKRKRCPTNEDIQRSEGEQQAAEQRKRGTQDGVKEEWGFWRGIHESTEDLQPWQYCSP